MLTGRKLALTLVFTVLVALAFGVSCKGFFVKPTLSSISVGPATPTIETGTTNNTVQMSAFGTFNDGSTGTPAVTWSSSEPSIATISTSGLVTSATTGSTTITATAVQNPSISGTQSVTVTVGCIQSIAVTPTSASIFVTNSPNTQQFKAEATTCHGTVDITNIASWTSSNTSDATVTSGLATAVAAGTVGITATSGSITSNSATLTVSP
jgi:hypothetical protein